MSYKPFSLALDSTYNFSLGLFHNKELVTHVDLPKGSINASDVLIPKVAQLLTNQNITLQDIAFVGITNGPGFFTGIRIGIVFAKMIHLALDIPITQHSALQVLAYEALQMNPQGETILACCHIGKQGMVYATFNKQCHYLQRETYIGVEQVADLVNSLNATNLIVVGNKQDLVENTKILNNIAFNKNILYPNIRILKELAAMKVLNKDYNQEIVPLYAKETDITIKGS